MVRKNLRKREKASSIVISKKLFHIKSNISLNNLNLIFSRLLRLGNELWSVSHDLGACKDSKR